jgi:ABC-type sugar transport system substrate-binding protein
MKKMKKVMSLLIVLAMVLAAMAGCSVESADSGKKEPAGDTADKNITQAAPTQAAQDTKDTPSEIVIGVSPKMVGAPYWDYANEGSKKAGEDLGVKIELQASTTASAQEQVSIIDNYITMGVDAIVVAANDETTLLPALQRASEAGIPIITYDSDVPDSDRLYCIAGTTQVGLGEMMAKELVGIMGEEGEVAYMTGSLSAFNHNQILKGYDNILSQYPGIKVVTTVESGDDQQKAFVNAENLLASYSNLKGILGVAAGETPSAAEAVVQAGKSGEIAVVGVATPNSVKKYYEDGTLESTILWDPYAMGYIAVKVAVNHLNGVEPKEGDVLYDGSNPVTIDADNNLYIGTTVFRKDNIDNFDF